MSLLRNRKRRNDPVWVITIVLILLSFAAGFSVGFVIAKDKEEERKREDD